MDLFDDEIKDDLREIANLVERGDTYNTTTYLKPLSIEQVSKHKYPDYIQNELDDIQRDWNNPTKTNEKVDDCILNWNDDVIAFFINNNE